MTEKTVKICGHDVRMRYCTATETGFERICNKSVFKLDFQLQEDLVALALAAIIAAYARDDEEAPVDSNTLLYDATPAEVVTLITTVLELRKEWYAVPDVVETPQQPEGETPKN